MKKVKDEWELLNYKITSDFEEADVKNFMTAELKDKLPDLYELALKGKRSSIKKLQKYINKYPNSPQLKNFLSVLYNEMGNTEKCYEINQWIVDDHPEYFFGLLNLALKYYSEEKYEKMPEILGKGFDVKSLYPNREIFHFVEVSGMFKAAVLYYSAIGEFDQAEKRLDIMEQIDAESEDLKQAIFYYDRHFMIESARRYDEQMKREIRPTILEIEKTKSYKEITMSRPLLYSLFLHGFELSETIINEIIALPRKQLIKDLENIIIDSINKFNYYSVGEIEEDQDESVVHSIFLLTELKSYESLEVILETLKQSQEYLDFYFGDVLTEVIWEPLLKLSKNQEEKLYDFMLMPGRFTFAKAAISTSILAKAYIYPEKEKEVEAWFINILEFYAEQTIESNIIDSLLIGFIVGDLIDLKAVSSLSIIEKLFKLKYVSISVSGDFEEVKKCFSKNEHAYKIEYKLLPMVERYAEFNNRWTNDEDDKVEKEISKIKETNIGRNDPCFCGSDKKYKKCCLNK